MKLYKVYQNTLLLLILFQICLKFCSNERPSELSNKLISKKNKLKDDINYNNINKNLKNQNSQSIDEYIDDILLKSNDINENNYFFLEEKTINKRRKFYNSNSNKNVKNNRTSNKTKQKKTKKSKKPFFNYKDNKKGAELDQGTFRSPNGKWNVINLIKATDLMLETFININPRLNVKNGKLWLTKILIKQYEECDSNADNKLDLNEFKDCVDNQKYFGVLKDVPMKDASKVFTRELKLQNIYGVSSLNNNISKSNSSSGKNKTNGKGDKSKNATSKSDKSKNNKNTNYLELIFNILNDSQNKYFSVYEYIKLRFLMIVYRKCLAVSFFISKNEVECIANDFNIEGYSEKFNSLSRIYDQVQSFSRFENLNELDTINVLSALQSINLFGKINKRHINPTVSKQAFLDALAAKELPQRYNAKNIHYVFSQLSHESGKQPDKIDLHSFVFIDRFLRIFAENSSKFKLVNVNENFIDVNGFINCFRNIFIQKSIFCEERHLYLHLYGIQIIQKNFDFILSYK